MREELFHRDREPPPLQLVDPNYKPEPPSLPLTGEWTPLEPDPTPIVAGPPRLAHAVRPELVRVAVAVGLTLYLVHALSPSHYGVFVLAASIGAAVGYPVVQALGLGVERLLTDDPSSPRRVRLAAAVALRAALPIAVVLGLVVVATAGLIAQAYGFPALGWPLRWAGVAIVAACALRILQVVTAGLPGGRVAGALVIGEAGLELIATVGLVVAGAGVSGAAVARPIAYAVAAALGAGLVLATGRRRGEAGPVSVEEDQDLNAHALARGTAGASATGLVWAAVVPVQAILLGALNGAPAVGSLGAEVRLLSPIAAISAVAALVYVRRATASVPDSGGEAGRTLKWSIVASGLLVAPSVVWASPISAGLLGSGYPGSAPILRWLAVYAFVAGPIAVLATIDGSRAGDAGRWALFVLALACSVLIGEAAIRAFGVAGAAMTVDGLALVTLLILLLTSSARAVFDRRAAVLTGLRTMLAAAAMAVVLLVAGTGHLSAVGWLAGAVGGVAAFAAVLLVAGEVSLGAIGGSAVTGHTRRQSG